MIKNSVIQHKLEKEKLISKDYVMREKLANAQELIESDLIKIITELRRAGKSVAAFLMLKKFFLKSESTLKLGQLRCDIVHKGKVLSASSFYFPGAVHPLAVGIDKYGDNKFRMVGVLTQHTVFLFNTFTISAPSSAIILETLFTF